MFTKYDLMNGKELRTELRRRGIKPYAIGKTWNMNFLWRQMLLELDKKKNQSVIECPNQESPILQKV